MPEYPLVSIVTPCFNMAAYVAETIESVLSQDYPRIEYIIMDGGSEDGTLDIIRRYEPRVRCVSQPDDGTADAVNRGFRLARGSLLGWISADDTYLPGAVTSAVQAFRGSPGTPAVYGRAHWVDERGAILGEYPTAPFEAALLARQCFICQPACFFRREAFEAAGALDPKLKSAFDWDLWIRLSAAGPFSFVPGILATSRMHRHNKTLGDRKQVFHEAFQVLKQHFGYVPYAWIFAYSCWLIDRRDQFFEPPRSSVLKYLLSLPVGLSNNRSQMRRYAAEWLSRFTLASIGTHWKQTWLDRREDESTPVPRKPERGPRNQA